MPVVQWVVSVGDTVETRDGELGVVKEIFEGPPHSAQGLFVSSEPYMVVVSPGQPDLYIPFEEIVDVSDVKQRVYLKRWLRRPTSPNHPRPPRSNPTPTAAFLHGHGWTAAPGPQVRPRHDPSRVGSIGSGTGSSPAIRSRWRASTPARCAGFASTPANFGRKIPMVASRRRTTRVHSGSSKTCGHRALT